jgi:Helicase conserved C-terminal domain
VTANWGTYERVDSETLLTPKGNPKRIWKRSQKTGTTSFALSEGALGPWSPAEDHPDVVVQGKVRKSDNHWVVTLFLVNNQKEPEQNRDAAWVFQPELVVESPDSKPVFLRRSKLRDPGKIDPFAYMEELSMAMLYRRHVEFAVGHGVAVHAETLPGDPTKAVRIRTRVIPVYDVPKTTPPDAKDIPALGSVVLGMKDLAETPDAEFSQTLGALADAYEEWIKQQQAKIADPAEGLKDFEEAAKESLSRCSAALKRIRDGLELIRTDPTAAEAFRFANMAMHLQRTHTLAAEAKRRGEIVDWNKFETTDKPSWYPFQLAFILLNLPSLTDLNHRDRTEIRNATADLLWFPTGGGKTEAYLGLTAYTIAIRRLQGVVEGRSGEDGIAVLMRYTLRLLTIQQFQRATALLCACEHIRRQPGNEKKWGKTPFRVGLWVGYRTTPNTTDQSAESVKQAHGHFWHGGGLGSPAQLRTCPWCGSEINPGRDVKVEIYGQGRGRTLIYCGDPLGQCLFTPKNSPKEGLPVLVVDEEIYRLVPSLIIATVDKFAQMPWKGETQMLFGQVNGLCPRHGFRSPEIEDTDSHVRRGDFPATKTIEHAPLRPPDLIIQDELHLISGPLGTLVGLYETAVDELCSWTVRGKRVRPKVIASTATIRRAQDQVSSLFLRNVAVFPPSGIAIEDNFFSLQREPSEENPGRRYIGICASGRRLKAGLIRVYVTLLASSQQLYDKYGTQADPWMTLVGYFNAMQELGGMRRLVDDDVRTRLQETDRRGLAKRRTPKLEELTSRRASTDIPQVLELLEAVFDPVLEAKRQAERKAGQKTTSPYPIDVLLATNMLSVGVDVKRLGLMVVGGQPKATAEYIQATSRVGRSRPGLVCTVLNWARPRDLSHYERFEHYHATFYQHVEALSVTPFAPRAIDRGLSALLVSLIRLAGIDFNPNDGATAVKWDHEFVKRAIETIASRAELVLGSKQAGDDIRNELKHRLDYWLAQAAMKTGGSRLGYQERKDGLTRGLLQQPTLGRWEQFSCLNSLREVEPTVNLVIDDGSFDDEPVVAQPAPSSGGLSS